MGLLLSSALDDVTTIEYSVEDIERLLRRYHLQRDVGSVEGLGKIAENIGVAFGDFLTRIRKNITTGISGYYSDMKRSALMELVDSNPRGMARVFEADYTTLQNISCAPYPFIPNPETINSYCKSTFETLVMLKRMNALIDEYLELSASIQISDANKAIGVISRINSTNSYSLQLDIKQTLINSVAKITQSKSSFGATFNSVGEYRDAIDTALLYANELEIGIKVSKLLPKLYLAFDKLRDSIIKASSSNFDLSSLAGIAGTVNQTGELLESYGMLVKEYHHLEWWLTSLSELCMAKLKK